MYYQLHNVNIEVLVQTQELNTFISLKVYHSMKTMGIYKYINAKQIQNDQIITL